MVLEIPPAAGGSITGSVDDCWQTALEDVGPAGVDKGKGGKYLITPPGYGEKVPDGYIPMPSPNYQGYALLRSILKSGADADVAQRSPTPDRSASIRCRPQPIRPHRPSSTLSTSFSTRPFPTTCASSSRWTGWCRLNPGWTATGR
jgi:hypothetical protein